MKTSSSLNRKFCKSTNSAIRFIKRTIARIIKKLTNQDSLFSNDLSKGDMLWNFNGYTFKR